MYDRIYMFLARTYRWVLFHIFWMKPIKENKVVISSFYGKGFGDNGKYLALKLHEISPEFQIVWIKKDPSVGQELFPSFIEVVELGSLRATYEMATAKLWIDNCRKDYICKRRNQIYLQTWHGLPIKKIEKDAEASLPKSYISNAIRDSKVCDFILSNGNYMTQIIQRSFWFSGKVLEFGSPRDDILIQGNEIIRNLVCEKFHFSTQKRIILYAPTFRNDHNLDVYNIDPKRLFHPFCKIFGGEWVFIFRLHPNISPKTLPNLEINEIDTFDASKYDDMQELLFACDVLISDYSSVMFEAAYSKKPVFLYAKDLETYTMERNFYLTFPSLPFPMARNEEELLEHISAFKKEDYAKKIDDFFCKIGVNETGNASETTIKYLLKTIGGKK